MGFPGSPRELRRLDINVVACLTIIATMTARCVLAGFSHSEGQYKIPTIVVQISDLHISRHQAEAWYPFGNITGDLESFQESILEYVEPDTVLITGDLTDGKSRIGRGEQHEKEWFEYKRILDSLQMKTPVLDVRGNHDRFNIHSTECDFYHSYSAASKFPKEVSRTKVHVLASGVLQEFEEWLLGEMQDICPELVLFGLDASTALGLRSPTNFVGLMNSQDVQEAEEKTRRVTTVLERKGCQSPVLSYGHFPLSTLSTFADSKNSSWLDLGLLGALRHASNSVHSMGNDLARAIAKTSAVYVSGHLHSAFGERLHRVHSLSDSKRYLTELETAAWKDDRRFRVLAADHGCMSFADFHFNTRSSPRFVKDCRKSEYIVKRGKTWMDAFHKNRWGLTAIDETAQGSAVLDSIPIVIWPPDRRYSLCEDHQERNEISVLLIDLDDVQVSNVSAMIYSEGNLIGSIVLQKKVSERRRYLYKSQSSVIIPSDAEEKHEKVYVQVKVTASRNGTEYISSISDKRGASMSCNRTVCSVGAYRGRGDLNLNIKESITLAVNWPNLVHRVYLCVFAILILGLVVARLITDSNPDAISARYHISYRRTYNPLSLMGSMFISLCLLSRYRRLWKCMVIYLLYLVSGPLYIAELLTDNSMFLIFHHGVIGIIKGELVIVPTPDVLLGQVIHLLLCVIPMILWLAAVMSRKLFSTLSQGTRVEKLTRSEMAILALISLINIMFVYEKAFRLMGVLCLLLSPGFAWTIPICVIAALHPLLSDPVKSIRLKERKHKFG